MQFRGEKMKTKETQILKNHKGQAMLEYIIITCLIGIFCLGMTKKFGSKLETRLKQMNQEIQNKLVVR